LKNCDRILEVARGSLQETNILQIDQTIVWTQKYFFLMCIKSYKIYRFLCNK
jgi:hypothetical protein